MIILLDHEVKDSCIGCVTNAEYEILRIIWHYPGISTKDIYQAIRRRQTWRPSTVKTLLFRLVSKSLVTKDTYYHQAHYYAQYSESIVVSVFIQRLLSRRETLSPEEFLVLVEANLQEGQTDDGELKINEKN